jgi:hypothetical protein
MGPGSLASVNTRPSIPDPYVDHEVPFQRAMRFTGSVPPAVKSPAGSGSSASTEPFSAAPRAVHAAPVQTAMRSTAAPPALVKDPPAIRSPLPSAHRAAPLASAPTPSVDQEGSFQQAIWLPGAEKPPPTTASPFGRTAIAKTDGNGPPATQLPRPTQFRLSQRAMLPTAVPPADVKRPPARNRPDGRAATAARAACATAGAGDAAVGSALPYGGLQAAAGHALRPPWRASACRAAENRNTCASW